jgi:hypothetical protein
MIASFKGGIMQEFNIILGGTIDVNSVNKSLDTIRTQIQPLKINVELNLDSVNKQIESLNLRIQEGLKGLNTGQVGGGITTTKNISSTGDPSKIITQGEKIQKVFKQTGDTVDVVTQKFNYMEDKITQNFEAPIKRAQVASEKSVATNQKLASSYDNLKARIQNLGNAGTISKDAVAGFNKKLEEANKIKDPIQKSNAFKQLGASISDSKKQVMGLGEQLKIAYSKFANQICDLVEKSALKNDVNCWKILKTY